MSNWFLNASQSYKNVKNLPKKGFVHFNPKL